jgi:hypothetical protein
MLVVMLFHVVVRGFVERKEEFAIRVSDFVIHVSGFVVRIGDFVIRVTGPRFEGDERRLRVEDSGSKVGE